MYTVIGAGSVGTVLAAMLAETGIAVTMCGRGATGHVEARGDDEVVRAAAPAVDEPEDVLFLCVHEPQIAEVCARWPGRDYVTFSNGVGGEAAAAEYGTVVGGVWRMTCTLREPGVADFTARGRVIVGAFSSGSEGLASVVEDDLASAGFKTALSEDIMADKWLKLLVNLASAPNALVRPADHNKPAFGELKGELLAEGAVVLHAAGIRAASCDQGDPSVIDEIERQRQTGSRSRPVHNSTWRLLARGRRPEERYHKTIAALATRHGIAAPRNAAMAALLDAATGPECYTLAEVEARLSGA